MKLANIPDGTPVALKYEDPESDKVSISSDIELDYAFSISTNQLLRLHMNIENTQSQQPLQPTINNPPNFDTQMNWRVRKEARLQHKIAKHEWKQQQIMTRVVPHSHFIPGSQLLQGTPYSIHQSPNPYMPPHGYSPVPHYFQSMPTAETLSEPMPFGKKIKELDARFISHQSYPDDTEVPCGVNFEKTWRFRNAGILKWPEGTVFLRVDRGNELSAPDTTRVASISPNQETDVTVQMISPASPGRYQSYFKLCSPSGKKFGQRMRCQILAVSDSSISPERIDKVWEQLEAMGFVEKGQRPNTISSIILRENCDVARIVRYLRNMK